METKFNHSIKVPTQYRAAASKLRKTLEEGASVKNQIFNDKHVRAQRLYALMGKISKHKPVLDRLIESSGILVENPRLDRYMCLVLMTELLFGIGKLNGESKPVEVVRSFKDKFDAILNDKNSGVLANDGDDDPLKELAPKPRYVRINLNLMSRSEAIETFAKDGWYDVTNDIDSYDKYLQAISQLGDFDYVSDIHVQNLFVFPASSKKFWARNPMVTEGKVMLQDKASCLPAVLLAPPKGSVVLDMCAAPGMKATHFASVMKNKGTVYAIEQNPERCRVLKKLVQSTKSSIVHVINQDSLSLSDEQVPNAQYILVDPSCSGSGMVDRLFKSDEGTQADRLYRLAGLQIKLLAHAMKTFPAAERIVYSTCSVYPEENEEVVQRCLEWYPHWELIKPIEFAEKWKSFGSPKYKHIGKKCLYARPDVDMTNGFFVALFQRREDVEFVPRPVKSRNGQKSMDIDRAPMDDALLDEHSEEASDRDPEKWEANAEVVNKTQEIDEAGDNQKNKWDFVSQNYDIGRPSGDDALFDEHSKGVSRKKRDEMEADPEVVNATEPIDDDATDRRQKKRKKKRDSVPLQVDAVFEGASKSKRGKMEANPEIANETEAIYDATDRGQEKRKKKKKKRDSVPENDVIDIPSKDDALFDEHAEKISMDKRSKTEANSEVVNEMRKKKKKKRDSVPENDSDMPSKDDTLLNEHSKGGLKKKRKTKLVVVNEKEEVDNATDRGEEKPKKKRDSLPESEEQVKRKSKKETDEDDYLPMTKKEEETSFWD